MSEVKTKMVVVRIDLNVREDKIDEFMETLAAHIKEHKAVPCVMGSVHHLTWDYDAIEAWIEE